MEYRLKYRDIPWGVAIGVLPGKIIGTFIIRPALNLKRNWKYILRKWLGRLLAVAVVIFVLVFVGMILEAASEGGLSRTFSVIFISWPGVTSEPAVVDLATPARLIGNHH